MFVRTSVVLLITAAACGSSDKPGTGPVDAAVRVDAAPPTVLEVTPCPATVALTVDAPDVDLVYTYAPTTPIISVGATVKFTMHSSHNVVPNVSMSDPGLEVGFNQTKCLMFTKAGAFGFHCAPHSFAGTITVQ